MSDNSRYYKQNPSLGGYFQGNAVSLPYEIRLTEGGNSGWCVRTKDFSAGTSSTHTSYTSYYFTAAEDMVKWLSDHLILNSLDTETEQE